MEEIGYVKTDARLDRLMVWPARHTDRYLLVREIRASVEGARLGDDGVIIPARSAGALLHSSKKLKLQWSEAATRFANNRSHVAQHHIAVRAQVERIKAEGVLFARALVADLEDSEILDEHQVVNIAAMVVSHSPGLAVFDEQGAGKTVTLIFAYDLLCKRRQANLLLVAAPKSMVLEWVRDFGRFKGDLYRVVPVSGSRREKINALRRPADVYVMNYEAFVSLEAEITSIIRARDGRAVLAVDESFFVKNLDAARTAALRRTREWCGRAFVLCGTPAPNRATDLVQQFNIVDFGSTFDGIELPLDPTDSSAMIQSAIDSKGLYVRHLKSDVLPGLPRKSFERVLCPLEPEQRRIYEGALNSLIIDLRGTDESTFRRRLSSFMARQMALRQICSNPKALFEDYNEVPAKLLALDSLLQELIERRGEKTIVWSFFRASLDIIANRYSKYNLVRYDGSVEAVGDRREAVRLFQEENSIRLFVGNPAAAGAGLTLHSARVAIYESLSNQAAHYLQSLDRIHRRGQKREVDYIVLLADQTIDVLEYDRLLKKERAAQELLGDTVTASLTRESLLNELLSLTFATAVRKRC